MEVGGTADLSHFPAARAKTDSSVAQPSSISIPMTSVTNPPLSFDRVEHHDIRHLAIRCVAGHVKLLRPNERS